MVRTNRRRQFFILSCLLLLVGLGIADLWVGSLPIGFKDLLGRTSGDAVHRQLIHDILFKIRLPRILTAILAGAGMALSGLQMQAIFRNPLADPHIMGVSAGAGTGAAMAVAILGSTGMTQAAHALSGLSIVAAAFLGAAFATILILSIATRLHSSNTLLIFGVILGFIFSAVTSIIAYCANAESLKSFYNWSAGSFMTTDTSEIIFILSALLIAAAIALANHKGMDLILFGDDFSEFAGASLPHIRTRALLSSCIMTAAVTAFCGPIGFVGIVAPHLVRKLTGTSLHRNILLPTLLTGSILTLGADLISQAGPIPLPVGSTIALIGIPIVLYILVRGNTDSNNS